MGTRKPVRLDRALEVEVTRAEGDVPAIFSASLSSEEPYQRWFGAEILDHSPGAVDLTRAAGGLPLLWGHNQDQPVGRVENVRIDGTRLRGDLRFFSTAQGRDCQTMVQEGHREMSIGYVIDKMRQLDSPPDAPVFKATRWSLLEASIVGVPADATVGIGRSAEVREMPELETRGTTVVTTVEECQTTTVVTTVTDDTGPAETDPADVGEDASDSADMAVMNFQGVHSMNQSQPAVSSVPDIIKLGEQYAHLGGDRVAAEYLRSGRSDIGEFRSILLEKVGNKVSDTRPDQLGLTTGEKRRFSMLRLVSALANPSDRAAQAAAAFEFEVSNAALQREGRSLRGNAQATIPADILQFSQRDLVAGTTTSGGYTVATDVLGGSFVDLLKNKCFVMSAGATVLSGLQGLVAIPSKTTAATAYWVAENTAPTEGAITFGQLTMSPKMVGAYVDISRRLINQSSIDAESLVRQDLVQQLAIAIDLAALNGAGTGSEPSGILTSTSVGTTTAGANGLAPVWADVVKLETLVATANADRGALAYFMNAKTRGALKGITKSTSAVAGFIWDGNADPVNGYPVYVTNQIPSNLTKGTTTGSCSAAIFGNWQDLVIGQWGGLDLMVDPYTGSNAGTVRVVTLQDVDILIRRTGSFAYIKDWIC